MKDKVELLKVGNLKIQFPLEGTWKTVVNDINFSIFQGEILGLVGESGSGKTISSLFLIGLLPRKAKIEFKSFSFNENQINGDDLAGYKHLSKSLRGREIGMIFQEPMSALNPTMTCGNQLTEIITEHLKVKKDDAISRAKDFLKKVDLDDSYFDKFPHQLSGGQQQRVMIAGAICCTPKLLIADEPTTALDSIVRKDILDLLKELSRSENLSILFISHDLPAVGSIADRIMVMKNGEIVERGISSKIISRPDHGYTKGLLNCIPTLNFSGERLPVFESDEKQSAPKRNGKKPITNFEIDEKKPILKIKNLSVNYQNESWLSFSKKTETKAVNNLTFNVLKGETLGIVGESGSGKSSLGKAIINLVDSKSGDVVFKDKKISHLTDNQWIELRKDIQIIFQNPLDSLNPKQPIGLGLIEILKISSYGDNSIDRKKRALEILETVGLNKEHFYKYPKEFSGGQRQRICIARALAVEPEVLICDECVSSLDVSIQAKILNLLKDLQEQFGLTILFISHDPGVVKFMSDRILVMKNGKMILLKETKQLFENKTNDYVNQLIDSIPK